MNTKLKRVVKITTETLMKIILKIKMRSMKLIMKKIPKIKMKLMKKIIWKIIKTKNF